MKLDLKNAQIVYQLVAALTVITLIAVGCIVVLRPFFPAMILATIFALSTWPAFTWLRGRLNGRATTAALLMTLFLSLLFIAPVSVIGTSVADHYRVVYNTVQETLRRDPAETAEHLKSFTYGGEFLAKGWMTVAADRESISAHLRQYLAPTTEILLKFGSTVGSGLFDVTLGVIIAFFLFRHGSSAATRIQTLTTTLGGDSGQRLLNVCSQTLIGVVYGMVGTALAQGTLAAIGFWIAKVPGAPFLGLITFFLSFIPMAPPLVWIPAAAWLFWSGEMGWGIFIVLWGALVVSMVDNIMKPYFISIGSNLPLVLSLLGIMGGVVAFGFIGLFIGPTLLALAYSLLMEWSTVRRAVENATSQA